MDLADVWAQHKKFILAIGGALLLLLIGTGVLGSQFDYEEVLRGAGKTADSIRKAEEVPESLVRELQSDVTALRSRYQELVGKMRYKVAPEFQLPASERDPRAYFFRRLREIQKALTTAAQHQDIRIPPQLGLKDATPTEPEEIRRTLVALDLIQQVVIESIGAGVRTIASIQIEDAQHARGKSASFTKELRVAFNIVGGERALRTLLVGLIDGAEHGTSSYVAIDTVRLRPVKGDVGMLELELALTALQIDKSDDEETP